MSRIRPAIVWCLADLKLGEREVAAELLGHTNDLAAAIWHNWATDAPVKRSLIAYDHWRTQESTIWTRWSVPGAQVRSQKVGAWGAGPRTRLGRISCCADGSGVSDIPFVASGDLRHGRLDLNSSRSSKIGS